MAGRSYTKTKTRKRTRTRRRAFVRRGRRKAIVRPDGLAKERITIEKPIYATDAVSAYMNIHWFHRQPGLPQYNTGMDEPSIASNTQYADM